jgi:hypothetical protein
MRLKCQEVTSELARYKQYVFLDESKYGQIFEQGSKFLKPKEQSLLETLRANLDWSEF